MAELGRTAILANPEAQDGKAYFKAQRVADLFRKAIGQDNVTLIGTEHAGHAIQLARDLHSAIDTLVVVGGDGVVHEAANGLMGLPKEKRPQFAVVPLGSGNDYAYTLGMPMKIDDAVKAIIDGKMHYLDVGCVNGEYFVETLSFGLDAAIALDTVQRRKKSSARGALLYMQSGISQLTTNRNPLAFDAVMFGLSDVETRTLSGESYIFAVQIGPTYGGHFKICPDASPTDGLFDICIAHPPIGAARAIAALMAAKNGKHTKMKPFEFFKAKALSVEFPKEPPAQADGEKIEGMLFDITMCPNELPVICAW